MSQIQCKLVLKSEPNEFSISDLEKLQSKSKKEDQEEPWSGVRNYQARNFMRAAKQGDHCFFYHSNCATPGVVGVCQISTAAFADPTQFDSKSKYYDSASKKSDPRWSCFAVTFVEKFKKVVPLDDIKEVLCDEDSQLVRRGNRLSITQILNKTASDKIFALARGSSVKEVNAKYRTKKGAEDEDEGSKNKMEAKRRDRD